MKDVKWKLLNLFNTEHVVTHSLIYNDWSAKQVGFQMSSERRRGESFGSQRERERERERESLFSKYAKQNIILN